MCFLRRHGLPQPHRMRMTHNLIVAYGLYRDLEVFVRSLFAGPLPGFLSRFLFSHVYCSVLP